ncbi:hypothetical protein B0H14DRAFT_2654022 [Mycena olivaceomarginata]|nr:hypothetical protein B0H14DRAFT_2654022 [Mycena olivaceomarginata]
MLDVDAVEFCIPIWWFTRGGEFFAKCWQMLPVSTDKGSGWWVFKSDNYEVPSRQFLKNFIQLQEDAALYNVPHPSHIIDIFDHATNQSIAWEYTNPVLGNCWQAKAKGSRVVIFPMWVYFDDTSGNALKQWNEHNSFLMTPVGLPIVDQLEKAQGDGIWVWDIELNEPVLVIPEVLAVLGDNPMQSHDAMDGDDEDEPVREKAANADGERSVAGSDAGSEQGSVAGSDNSAASAQGQAKKCEPAKRFRETMKQMADRVRDFMKIGKLHHKNETTEKLQLFFTDASTKLDTKTSVKKSRTEHGLKDKFQMLKKHGVETKRATLEAAVATQPYDTMSPVWRIKGLDPHQDTPVEILHVVLLGFVKYLWRDLTQQLKGKDDKKELLTPCLSSLDVSGLSISPLAGRTLVRYSGSLTGRDFRAITQVALFVLYDLVSKECFETWQALSKVIPLIWQPEIGNIESHQ